MVGAERVAGRVVMDAFCGVGGSAVHLARRCPHVIGVDSCRPRLDLAAHNAGVYGVAHRLELLCADFLCLPATMQVAPQLSLTMTACSKHMHTSERQIETILPLAV